MANDMALITETYVTGYSSVDSMAAIGLGQNMLVVNYPPTDVKLESLGGSSSSSSSSVAELVWNGDGGGADISSDVERYLELRGMVREATDLADSGTDVILKLSGTSVFQAIWDHSSKVIDELRRSNPSYSKMTQEESTMSDNTEKEADSSERRAFYGEIVGHACNYNEKKGGGSLTVVLGTVLEESEVGDAVFTMEDFGDYPEKIRERIAMLEGRGIKIDEGTLQKLKITSPVTERVTAAGLLVDTLKSLSDGHLTFRSSPKIPFTPPLDVTASLCRIGLGADITSRSCSKAAAEFGAGSLRVALCQDADAMESSAEAVRVKACMMQGRRKKRTLAETCFRLGCVQVGALKGSVEEVDAMMTELYDKAKEEWGAVFAEIDETRDLGKEDVEGIVAWVENEMNKVAMLDGAFEAVKDDKEGKNPDKKEKTKKAWGVRE